MKSLFSIKTLSMSFVAMLFGALVALVSGFNPAYGAVISFAGSTIAQAPAGSLHAGVDLSAVVSDLGAYLQVPKTAIEIWSRLFTGLELNPYLTKKGGVTGSYAGVASSTSELMQPFQQGFTPKGTTTFTPFMNQVYRAKVDFLLDNIDDVVGSWLMFLHDETVERKDWPLVRFIVEKELLPKLVEEMNAAMCRGVYVAPTAGTAGTSLGTMNGLLKIVADQITATALTPIATGTIAASTGLDKFETFADGIDPKYSGKGGVIFCSKTLERYYKSDYRATFGATNDQAAKNQTKLDHYNIEIVGLEGFATSSRMVFVQKGNLLGLYDKIFTPSTFQVQQDKRDVILMSDWHIGVGLNTLDGVFVNDQA